MFISFPRSTPSMSSIEMATSRSGIKLISNYKSIWFICYDGWVYSLIVNIILPFIYSKSDQIESKGRSCFLYFSSTSIMLLRLRYPHRLWWKPRLQKGGMWLRPIYSWYLSSNDSGSWFPITTIKWITPPRKLNYNRSVSYEAFNNKPWVFLK